MSRFLLRSTFLLYCTLLAVSSLQAQSWQWAVAPAVSGPNQSLCPAVVVDGAGNTIVAGTFTGTMTLGSFTLTSAGSNDLFVAKLSQAGIWTQAVRAGGPDYEYATDLALAPTGEVIVAGYFKSATLLLGATTLINASPNGGNSSTDDIFVARLSSTGTWTQAVRAGGPDSENVRSLAIDAAGNTVVTGIFSDTAVFGNFALTCLETGVAAQDVFVARLSAAGTWLQAVRAGGLGMDDVAGVAVASTGEVVIAGDFLGSSITFGALTLVNSGSSGTDAYVARLTSAGTWVQAVSGGGERNEDITGLAFDAADNVIVAGTSRGSSMWGTIALATGGVIVARLSSSGTWTQAERGGSGGESLTGFAVDRAGNATVSGYYSTYTSTFGTLTLTNSNQYIPGVTNPTAELFVARLNAAGSWTQTIGASGMGNDTAQHLALTSSGNPVITGAFGSSTLAFGPTVLSNGGNNNSIFFVARLDGIPTANRATTFAETFTLAPTPATTATGLTWPAATPAPRPVQVLDGLGRTVRQQVLPAHATQASLDLVGLVPGLYLVRCGTAVGRLVVE